MDQVLYGLGVFLALGFVIFGVVVAIPALVYLSTKDWKNDMSPVMSVFWEETGDRGDKAVSAIGLSVPFWEIASPAEDLEGFVVLSIMAIVGIAYHSTVYRGYPVLDKKMKLKLAALLAFYGAISGLTYIGALASEICFFMLSTSSIAWGYYAVYKRAELVHAERCESLAESNDS